MKRKLIKQGSGNGLVLYVPKLWIDKKGLKAGDEVEIEEKEEFLEIRSSKVSKRTIQKEIILDFNNINSLKGMRIYLAHAYRLGVERIIVKSNNDIQNKIEDIIEKRLLGFEVLEVQENNLILENITEPSIEKYDLLIRKAFFSIKEIITELNLENFSSSKIKKISVNVNKHILCCLRILNILEKNTINWEFVKFLMSIHHAIHYFEQEASKSNNMSNNLKKYLPKLKICFENLYDIYYNKSFKEYEKGRKEIQNILFVVMKNEKIKSNEVYLFSLLRECFRQIQLSSSPLLSKIIDL